MSDRHGGTARAAVMPDSTGRSLYEITLENAAEGCVEESYGAALAHWQAAHAEDPAVRNVMAVIAGMPTPEVARRLYDDLQNELWRQPTA